MTTYNYIDILESIPPEVWKDLPCYNTALHSRYKRDLCKNKVALQYMLPIINTLHFPKLQVGDELQFDMWKYPKISKATNVHSATFTKGKHSDKALNLSSVLVNSNYWSIVSNPFEKHSSWYRLSWSLWDFIRKNKIAEYKASILTEEQLLHIAVQQTESTLVIASKVNKIEAEVQALKQKIASGTLCLEDTKNFYHQVYENLLEVNRNNKNLPK